MKNLELILKERANRNTRVDWPWDAFYQKTTRADKLLDAVVKNIHSRHCIQEARKQYVTAIVTAFEVYFKDSLLRLLNKQGNDKLFNVVDTKFNLSEIKKILEHKISVNEVITSYYNFQDLDHINKAFSNLLGIKFFEVLKIREFEVSENLPPFVLHKKFYEKIKALIELRHDFVHDINFKKNISKYELNNLTIPANDFVLATDIYLMEMENNKP